MPLWREIAGTNSEHCLPALLTWHQGKTALPVRNFAKLLPANSSKQGWCLSWCLALIPLLPARPRPPQARPLRPRLFSARRGRSWRGVTLATAPMRAKGGSSGSRQEEWDACKIKAMIPSTLAGCDARDNAYACKGGQFRVV